MLASTLVINSWNRSNKPDTKDFSPAFKDDTHWIRAKEHFQTTLAAQGLSHLINKGHVMTNPQLDTYHHAWLFKILQDVMQQPICTAIMINHLGDEDTVSIWKEGKSMIAQFTSQSISTYLTLARPMPTTGWKGSQQSFLLDYSEKT
jgi:hypothetical protein